MNAPLPSPTPSGARRTARDRDLRQVRILALLQAGWSYAAIAREEALSRERVRQIVAQAVEAGEGETKLVHAHVQIARLEPALRLAARGVADGELSATDRLLRVLDRLDKYSAIEDAGAPYDENARERLLTKLNSMAKRMLAAREKNVTAGSGARDNEAGRHENSPNDDAVLDAP